MASIRPYFAKVIPYGSRQAIPTAISRKGLSTWVAGLRSLSHSTDEEFLAEINSNQSISIFIQSYILNDDITTTNDWLYSSEEPKANYIRNAVFHLLKRSAKLDSGNLILTPRALVKLAGLYFSSKAKSLLSALWTSSEVWVREAFKEHMSYMARIMSDIGNANAPPSILDVAMLQELSYFIMALPQVSSDILSNEVLFETLLETYHILVSQQREAIAVAGQVLEEIRRLAFISIVSGMLPGRKGYSSTIDFLLNLITEAEIEGRTERQPGHAKSAFISAIVSQTPLLSKLSRLSPHGYENRWATVVQKLRNFEKRAPSSKKMSALPRVVSKRDAHKNRDRKLNVAKGVGDGVDKLKELFPHVELKILSKVFEINNHNIELATMALIDGIGPGDSVMMEQLENPLEKRIENPPDYDELYNLSVPADRLYWGKRNLEASADTMLSDKANAPSKAMILAALQSFDSDDDERDDTYDMDDVGGVVDAVAVDGEGLALQTSDGPEDERLYKTLIENPSVFARDSATRRSAARQKLREITGLSDEALEGWKIMLDRDGGKRLRQLEIKFSRDAGVQEQATLLRTAYRKPDSEPAGEEPVNPGGESTTVRGQRGSPRKKSTQPSRGQDYRYKTTRGSHNRKNQRAKKVSRGGFQGTD
ncbi:hypothetical protein ABW19_dt0202282 [Dactylella cylindrospora]|nr:hypothetical protein ABW19_dt0202282 [Dactylella cylindrospora]